MDSNGWQYTIIVWNEDMEPSYYFTDNDDAVKNFMGKVEYMDVKRVKVINNFGVYLGKNTA